MKRLLCLTGLLLVCLCACGAPAGVPADDPPAAATPPASNAIATPPAYAGPLSYMRAEQEYGDSSFISYPYIMDAAYDSVNYAMQSAIRTALNALSVPTYTRCDIMCNDCGLFSVRIVVRDLATQQETLAVVALTFDAATGEQVYLSNLFDPENERWRGLIPDIVMLQAEKKGVTLLCDVMPASDEQAFYVTESALVILYRPYEIATNSAGWPEFTIPLYQLTDFLLQDGPLLRLAEGNAVRLEPIAGNAETDNASEQSTGTEEKKP